MSQLAELSSITSSPAPSQDKLYWSSVNRAPPCNSTPRSPDVRRRVRTGFIEADLPDSLVCSHLSSVYQRTESFTTPRESSVDSVSSPQGFITASQEEGPLETASSSRRQEETDQSVYVEAEEGLEEMEKRLQMVKECTIGEENMEEEEGGKHIEEGSEEEEHGWCDPQRDGGSKVEEEEDIDDRRKEITGLFGNGAETGDHALVTISELAADTVAEEQKKKLSVSPGSQQSPTLLEDTNRAHSTLDEVLQGFVVEGSTKSPGTSQRVPTVHQLFEGQTDDEEGDHLHTIGST